MARAARVTERSASRHTHQRQPHEARRLRSLRLPHGKARDSTGGASACAQRQPPCLAAASEGGALRSILASATRQGARRYGRRERTHAAPHPPRASAAADRGTPRAILASATARRETERHGHSANRHTRQPPDACRVQSTWQSERRRGRRKRATDETAATEQACTGAGQHGRHERTSAAPLPPHLAAAPDGGVPRSSLAWQGAKRHGHHAHQRQPLEACRPRSLRLPQGKARDNAGGASARAHSHLRAATAAADRGASRRIAHGAAARGTAAAIRGVPHSVLAPATVTKARDNTGARAHAQREPPQVTAAADQGTSRSTLVPAEQLGARQYGRSVSHRRQPRHAASTFVPATG